MNGKLIYDFVKWEFRWLIRRTQTTQTGAEARGK